MSSTAQCSHGSRPPPPRRRYLKSISSPSGQLASSWYTARSMARMECHGRMLVTLSADQAGRRAGQGRAKMPSCRLDSDTRSGPAQSWPRASAPGHESQGSRSAGRCAPVARAGPGWRRTGRMDCSCVTLRPDPTPERDRPWSTTADPRATTNARRLAAQAIGFRTKKNATLHVSQRCCTLIIPPSAKTCPTGAISSL